MVSLRLTRDRLKEVTKTLKQKPAENAKTHKNKTVEEVRKRGIQPMPSSRARK